MEETPPRTSLSSEQTNDKVGKVPRLQGETENEMDSSSSCSDDEEAWLAGAAFRRRHNSLADKNNKIRRFDEFGDYLIRSERSIRFKPNEQAPISKPNRAVTFAETLCRIHEITPLKTFDLYLRRQDFKNIDQGIQKTCQSWEDFVLERKDWFDYEKDTIRGLECLVDEDVAVERDYAILCHRKALLKEQNRQRANREYLNVQKMQAAALQINTSMRQDKLAQQRAAADYKDAIECWHLTKASVQSSSSTSSLASAQPDQTTAPCTLPTLHHSEMKRTQKGGLLGTLSD